ncbi:hypothetical protein HKD37_14G040202 [Glycine soja]
MGVLFFHVNSMHGATTIGTFSEDMPRGAGVAIPTSAFPFSYVALESPTCLATWAWCHAVAAGGQGCSDQGRAIGGCALQEGGAIAFCDFLSKKNCSINASPLHCSVTPHTSTFILLLQKAWFLWFLVLLWFVPIASNFLIRNSFRLRIVLGSDQWHLCRQAHQIYKLGLVQLMVTFCECNLCMFQNMFGMGNQTENYISDELSPRIKVKNKYHRKLFLFFENLGFTGY